MYSFIIVNKTRKEYWISNVCFKDKIEAYNYAKERLDRVKQIVLDEFFIDVFNINETEKYELQYKEIDKYTPVDTYADWFSTSGK